MLDKIKERLQTGTISNVIIRGEGVTLSSPYVVIWADRRDNGRAIVVSVHYDQGNQNALEDYAYNELSDLLGDWITTDRHGNNVRIIDEGEANELPPVQDDSTIVIERVFLVPSQIY